MKNNLIKNITLGAILFVPGTTLLNNDVYASENISEISFTRDAAAIAAATTAVDTAVADTTTVNIKIARGLVNDLPEGSEKKALQERLDALTVITDLDFPRKNVTANLDVYIRCENLLSLSLDTNSVTFEEFSGVQDMEKPNAVTLTVISSLAYDLNAYLPVGITSADGQQSMLSDTIEIKAHDEGAYQKFPGIGDTADKKVVLLTNQPPTRDGEEHGIDLQLAGGYAHGADIYKTTIKFEAAQI